MGDLTFDSVSVIGARRALFAACGSLLLALALGGCGSTASWATVNVASTYQPPRTVTLKVNESPAGGDVATLEMALVDAFSKLDIHATPLDEADARPMLRVIIEKWAPGSKAGRGLLNVLGGLVGLGGAGGLGEGEIVVGVEVLSEEGELAIRGKARSWVNDDADDSIHDIADLIATMVASGAPWPKQPPQPPRTGYPYGREGTPDPEQQDLTQIAPNGERSLRFWIELCAFARA